MNEKTCGENCGRWTAVYGRCNCILAEKGSQCSAPDFYIERGDSVGKVASDAVEMLLGICGSTDGESQTTDAAEVGKLQERLSALGVETDGSSDKEEA